MKKVAIKRTNNFLQTPNKTKVERSAFVYFYLTKNQIVALTVVSMVFVGNGMFMNYLSDGSPFGTSNFGKKVSEFTSVGYDEVLADTQKIFSRQEVEEKIKQKEGTLADFSVAVATIEVAGDGATSTASIADTDSPKTSFTLIESKIFKAGETSSDSGEQTNN